MVERAGWQVPWIYSTPERERAALRGGLGLLDASSFPKIGLHGLGLSAFASALAHGPGLEQPGRVMRLKASELCLACRLAESQLFLCTAGFEGDGLRALLAGVPRPERIAERDETSCYAGVALLGPKLESALQRLAALDTSSAVFAPGTCVQTRVAGVHALVIRPPDLGIPAVLIYVAWDLAAYLWDTLLRMGQSAGIEPVGFQAWESALRSGQSQKDAAEKRLVEAERQLANPGLKPEQRTSADGTMWSVPRINHVRTTVG